MILPRAEPPHVADEATMLRTFLDHYRATLVLITDGLTADQLGQRLGPSTLTLGGLLKHLAWVEDWWFVVNLLGEPASAPWADADWDADPDWELTSAVHDSPDDLRALFLAAVDRSNAILDRNSNLDAVTVRLHPRTGEAISLRWILVHLIEEYARHAGHADLIRESIDGATDV